jgi:hypothetical protein
MQAAGEAPGGSHGRFMTDLEPTPKVMWAPVLALRDENKTISARLSGIKAGIGIRHETVRLVCIKGLFILRYPIFREPWSLEDIRRESCVYVSLCSTDGRGADRVAQG